MLDQPGSTGSPESASQGATSDAHTTLLSLLSVQSQHVETGLCACGSLVVQTPNRESHAPYACVHMSLALQHGLCQHSNRCASMVCQKPRTESLSSCASVRSIFWSKLDWLSATSISRIMLSCCLLFAVRCRCSADWLSADWLSAVWLSTGWLSAVLAACSLAGMLTVWNVLTYFGVAL